MKKIKTSWQFSIVMLQWWEKEATQKKTQKNIKNNIVKMKTFLKLKTII